MKSSGPFLLLLFLLSLSSTVSGLGSVVQKGYTYNSDHNTWQDAQSRCRSSSPFGDLVTIFQQSDEASINVGGNYAWFGLNKPKNSYYWYWANGDYDGWYQSNGDYDSYRTNGVWTWPYHENNAYCAFTAFPNTWYSGTSCGESYFFFCHKQTGNNYDYTFVPQSMTWSKARQYCRTDANHDLATFDSSDLSSTLVQQDFPVWTGLHRDAKGTWTWGTGLSKYRNWAPNQPGDGDCVSISSTSKKMSTQSCSARFPFLCFVDNVVLVKENKTWEEALKHCRALKSTSQPNLRYDLLSVQPGEDQDYVMNMVMDADTEEVWTGLRFLAGEWLWVNGARMSYSDLPLCPHPVQHCGALSKINTRSVETKDCAERRNFLCYSTF